MIPTTYLQLHMVRSITASACDSGQPLILQIDSRDGPMQITLFFDTPDYPDRTQALADALNAAMAIDLPPIPEDGSEAAAYAAATLAYEYQGSVR
jgi:hypothetical protein